MERKRKKWDGGGGGVKSKKIFTFFLSPSNSIPTARTSVDGSFHRVPFKTRHYQNERRADSQSTKCSRRHATRHQPQRRRAVATIGTTLYSRCSKKKSYNKVNTVNFSSTTANQVQFNNNRQSISVQQPPINFSSNP